MHTFGLVLVLLMLASSTATAEPRPKAAPDRSSVPGGARVRPHDGRAAALLLEGLKRSRIFRELVDQLEAGDVIVYVQTEHSLRGRLAGKLTWLSATPHFRYVRISVSPDLGGDFAIASLGHELSHALEVANEPSVVDPESLTAYYRKIGISMKSHVNGWDTEAARDLGDDVRRELSVTRAMRVADASPRFEPLEWDTTYRDARDRAR